MTANGSAEGDVTVLERIEYQDLVIDVAAWEVSHRGVPVELTKTEFQMLVALASRPRRVVTSEELTELLWGDNWYGDDGNLAVHISKLRSKLGESGLQPRHIRTVRGVGYRFEPEPDGVREGWVASGERSCDISATLLLDLDRRIRWASQNTRDLLGWNPSDLVGIRPREIIHADDVNLALEVMEVVQTGEPRLAHCRVRTADGDFRRLAMAVRPISSAVGRVTGFLAEWQSLERGFPEEDLRPVQLPEPLFETQETRTVTLTFDGDFILRDIAPRVSIFDWKPDDIIGRFFSPSDRDEETLRSTAAATIAANGHEFHGPINVRRRDGSLVAVQASTYIDLDQDKGFAGYRTVLHLPIEGPESPG